MNEKIKDLVIVIVGLSISILTSALVMIYGWGLQPKSWWWIIGIYTIGQIIAQMFIRLGKSKSK